MRLSLLSKHQDTFHAQPNDDGEYSPYSERVSQAQALFAAAKRRGWSVVQYLHDMRGHYPVKAGQICVSKVMCQFIRCGYWSLWQIYLCPADTRKVREEHRVNGGDPSRYVPMDMVNSDDLHSALSLLFDQVYLSDDGGSGDLDGDLVEGRLTNVRLDWRLEQFSERAYVRKQKNKRARRSKRKHSLEA